MGTTGNHQHRRVTSADFYEVTLERMTDLPTALNIASIAVGFVAGVCFCIGSATTKPKTIALASASIIGANPALMRSFSMQRSQYIVGALSLIVSFLLQAAAALVPKDIPLPLPPFFQEPLALLLSVLLLASVLAFLAVSRTITTTEQAAQQELLLLQENQRRGKS